MMLIQACQEVRRHPYLFVMAEKARTFYRFEANPVPDIDEGNRGEAQHYSECSKPVSGDNY